VNAYRLGSALALVLAMHTASPAQAASLLNGRITGCAPAANPGLDRLLLRVYGLTTDQRLLCFRDRSPNIVTSIGVVSGLTTDTAIVGMDFRVQDGLLYGVGNAGGVYVIDTATAAATLVNRLSVAQSGTAFGVDFNPAADRLRVISDTGQNLRHNVNAGGVTLSDTTLSYTAPNAATGVIGAAYTNNDLDASTATTLFNVDVAMDQVVLQSPANAGTLAATGKLGVDATVAGMDIYSTVRNGRTIDNEALAVLVSGGVARLYEVDLTTGRAVPRGTFAAENPVFDIAIPLGQR
jgi:hypothetical protein